MIQGPRGGRGGVDGGGGFRAIPLLHGLNFVLALRLSFGRFGEIGPRRDMAGDVFPVMAFEFGSVSKNPFGFVGFQERGDGAFAPFVAFQAVAGGGGRWFFGRWVVVGGGGVEMVVVVK